MLPVLWIGCDLGLSSRSHAMNYQGILGLNFPLDLKSVLRMTSLRFRDGSIAADINTELVGDGLLNDSYFKVRRQDGDSGTRPNHELLDSDEDEDGDGDEEDDEEDDNDNEDEDEEEEEGEGEDANENWNIVDVMPSYGRPNREGESLFQLGATIMPGVMGMMESFGARHPMLAAAHAEPPATQPTYTYQQGIKALRRKGFL
ncbi:hypothetical protein CLU79DRAFT_529809 [Phycomyces nitens]|nr:hypothetical protein CLU79DRAFT_529809 [Phycomyces nitens]